MNFVILILLVLAVILSIKYIAIKKQIHSISRQIEQVTSRESEKMLDISLVDPDLELLAGRINTVFAIQRTAAAKTLQHEEHLKESIAGISHDLRTPLTVIIGHLQMLKDTDLQLDQLKRVETALRKSGRLKDLIDTFYDLSLLEAEQTEPHWEKINLSNLLIDFLAENAPLFESRHIKPRIKIPDTSVFILADRSMLDRILQNLTTNAVRYTTGAVDISLTLSPDGRAVFQISNPVHDPKKLDVDRLFNRFYTGDPSRGTESTGLGLSVVKILLEKIQGSVFASVRGSVLYITVTLKAQRKH